MPRDKIIENWWENAGNAIPMNYKERQWMLFCWIQHGHNETICGS